MTMSTAIDPTARPFLKWAGGKTKLLPEILARLPAKIQTYYEPFIGGGAAFFALAAEGRFQRAVLSDSNGDLVEVYRVVRDNVEMLIDILGQFCNSEEFYYAEREHVPATQTKRAARIILLNRTGFNGLYRVNSSGKYNVPYGHRKNPVICNVDGLRAASAALQGVELETGDFERACSAARKGDAVYLDPPYRPLSKTSSFTSYDRCAFGLAQHERLAGLFARLQTRGVCTVLSNSDTPATRALYEPAITSTVWAPRAINSKGDRRGKISELMVSTAPLEVAK
jgi:DNA adenine methylase